MGTFHIDIDENGYCIQEKETGLVIIEGIEEWNVACELHEMLTVEYNRSRL
ncbi:hypothetical protein ACQZV8_01775 [Magnetococcales bacterium HHB-1]